MAAFLAAFAPESDALLAAVAQRVDEGMLTEIAMADYGFRVEEHLAGLRALRDLEPPRALGWTPREVLELIRWSEPDQPESTGGAKGARGHWMRAFCCVALLRAAGGIDGGEHRHTINETLIQLLASLDALGEGLHRETAALLAWCIPAMGDGEQAERAFLGVGLLWCALEARLGDDAAIAGLCAWIAAQEEAATRHTRAADAALDFPSRPWLLAATFHGQRHYLWRELGVRIGACDPAHLTPSTREWVRLIGAALAG